MTNLVSLRTLLGFSIALTAIACSSRSRSIEVPTPKPTNSNDATSPQGDDDQGRDANATLVIPQEVAQKYLDAKNGAASYQFTYLDIDQKGDLTFANGNAVIELKALPSGLEGPMTLKILEGAKVKLEGSQDGVKLNPGTNKLTLKLKPVDDGKGNNNGDKNADLQLEIVIDDGTGTTTPPTTGTTPPTGGALKFTDVKAIATKACYGSCHFHKDANDAREEKFWLDRKDTVVAHMEGSGTTSKMPIPDSDEEKALSADERQRLIDFVNGL